MEGVLGLWRNHRLYVFVRACSDRFPAKATSSWFFPFAIREFTLFYEGELPDLSWWIYLITSGYGSSLLRGMELAFLRFIYKENPLRGAPTAHPREGVMSSTPYQRISTPLILEQIPALLWVADTNLTITFVQGHILRTLGLTPEGVVGTTVPEYFPVEPTSTPFETHLRALQGDPGSYVATFKERTLRAYVEPMRNPNGAITGCIGIALDITEQKELEEQRERLIEELRNALTHIKTLRGLLPICAACKKIRDDRGYWTQIEQYIRAHSEAEFTHGICPECVKKLYPELSSRQ